MTTNPTSDIHSKRVPARVLVATASIVIAAASTAALVNRKPAQIERDGSASTLAVEIAATEPAVSHRSIEVEGQRIFYREAGPEGAPTVLLLHGFPTSSHMFRNLILDREGNEEIQLALFYSYGSNPPLYPEWQSYFREHQPPTLLTWGKNDPISPEQGAHPYKRDLKNLEFHILDTGHFALEEDGAQIASLMREFLGRNVDSEK